MTLDSSFSTLDSRLSTPQSIQPSILNLTNFHRISHLPHSFHCIYICSIWVTPGLLLVRLSVCLDKTRQNDKSRDKIENQYSYILQHNTTQESERERYSELSISDVETSLTNSRRSFVRFCLRLARRKEEGYHN